MGVPKHFDGDSKRFGIYILECAMRDRQSWLDVMDGCNSEDDIKAKREVVIEIKEMKRRIKLIS